MCLGEEKSKILYWDKISLTKKMKIFQPKTGRKAPLSMMNQQSNVFPIGALRIIYLPHYWRDTTMDR